MFEEYRELVRAARQLIDTEELLGSGFIPASEHPLPPAKVAKAAGGGPAPPAAPAPPRPRGMPPDQKAAALEKIDVEEVRSCVRCGLSRGRTQTVFGEGSADAELLFVGEGPGREEDRTGRPFVGRAGELLTKMIQAMGLRRADVFICNLVKCRPPGNRSPAPDEVGACWDYLVRQLEIIRPRVIVALGSPATQALLNTRTGITKLRGQWQSLPLLSDKLQGTPVMPTFHPAFLLRQYSQENRMKVWSDLQQVMAALGLPLPKK
jgi:DNA polymerase